MTIFSCKILIPSIAPLLLMAQRFRFPHCMTGRGKKGRVGDLYIESGYYAQPEGERFLRGMM